MGDDQADDGAVPASASPAPVTPPSTRSSWVAQLSLILTLAVALIAAFRLLAVATWSRRTAVAILQTTGTTQVVTGALISSFGIASGVAMGAYVMLRGYRLACTSVSPTRTDWVMLGVAVLVNALIAPLVVAGAVLVVVSAVVVLGRQHGKDPGRRNGQLAIPANAVLAWTLGLGGAAALLAVFVDPRPWLPPENLTFRPDLHVQSGYVLHLDERDLTLLVGHRPRRIVHVIDPRLSAREICGGASLWWDSSLLKNALGPTPFPECAQPI